MARQLVGSDDAPKSQNLPCDYGDGNRVINHPKQDNANIVFQGKNNILYCESSDTIFQNCQILFEGDNSVLYVSRHSNRKRKYRTKIYIHHNSAVYIGENVNFHPGGEIYIVASENKNIIIGDDCLFSLGVVLRASDGHAAYDAKTKERLNFGKSIFIGDHVWLGQNVTILKGAKIGSGSIIGAGTVVTGKTLPSNSSCAGAPARVLKKDVFFSKPNVNRYTKEQLEDVKKLDTDEWVYEKDTSTLSFDDIDISLSSAKTSDKKLTYIKKHLAKHKSKNRFFIT